MRMANSKEIFTVSSTEKTHVPSSYDVLSPKNGILKSVFPASGKVNTNPNWRTPSENGPALIPESNSNTKKQVRHSIVSIDSTADASEAETALSARVRCQKKLSVYLHTHVVLIIVCSLAILDAVCVIGQLICDILIMKEKLSYLEDVDEKLTQVLLDEMPQLNRTIHDKWNLHAILQVLLGVDIHGYRDPLLSPVLQDKFSPSLWNNNKVNLLLTTPADGQSRNSLLRRRRAIEPKVPGHEVDHGVLYELTHTFHLGSLVILSLLLLETLLKVFAMGKKLKHHKLEVFDALVVTVSWCLDVAFWEGIWAHPGPQAATILIYLLPWRVVRIVNSFVLVIQEKEHVHLKIIKQRLRQSIKKSKEVLEKASTYRHEVKALAGLCRKFGATETEITACSPSGKAGRRGSVQSVLERAASLTFISTMSSMGSLPSLFDMTDSSSDEDEQGSNRSVLEGETSYNRTLKSAVSCTTLDSGSEVFVPDGGEHVAQGYQEPAANKRGRKSRGNSGSDATDRTCSTDSVPPHYDDLAKTNNDTRL